jgi:hypothetical protein
LPHIHLAVQDNRLLWEIYGDLESPSVQAQGEIQHPDGDVISDVLAGKREHISGLHTRLRPYQRRTVAAMIARELDLEPAPDPLYLSLSCSDDRAVYWQPTRMEFHREQPSVQPTRGGILCEELGTGKTVMVLATILATQHQLSTPEELISVPPVLTPLALRHFPDEDFVDARRRAGHVEDTELEIPSLVETMFHYLRTTRFRSAVRDQQAEIERHLPALSGLLNEVELNSPFYLHYEHDAFLLESQTRRRSPRKVLNPSSRTVYLTSGTLLIVPDNLMGQ